jgi:hypothetical protein
MTDETESEETEDTGGSGGTVTNPFAAGLIDEELFQSLDALQTVVAEQEAAMQGVAALVSDESLSEIHEAAQVLDEYDEAIWTTQQLARLFNEEISTELEQLAATVQELGELEAALQQNPVTIPAIDLQVIDPELLDLMVTDFSQGPVAEPLVEESLAVDPAEDETVSMTPEEWFELGIEADMILTCDNCRSAVLQENSHRYQPQEDGQLVCPQCGTTGRAFQ